MYCPDCNVPLKAPLVAASILPSVPTVKVDAEFTHSEIPDPQVGPRAPNVPPLLIAMGALVVILLPEICTGLLDP